MFVLHLLREPAGLHQSGGRGGASQGPHIVNDDALHPEPDEFLADDLAEESSSDDHEIVHGIASRNSEIAVPSHPYVKQLRNPWRIS